MSGRLAALFDAHADRLYRLARRLTSSSDDALDLVQDTFVKAARSPESVPYGPSDEEAWFVRVLVNLRRDQWRKENVRKRHERALRQTAVESEDPESTFVIRTTVWRALDHLPPRRRAVVVMREIEGLSIPSIASLLGISAITVRWHLSVGRRELGRRLEFQLGRTHEEPHHAVAARGPTP